jgi:hypothetical protein
MCDTLRQDFYVRRKCFKNLGAKIIIGIFLCVVKFVKFYSFVYCWYCECQGLILTTDKKVKINFVIKK